MASDDLRTISRHLSPARLDLRRVFEQPGRRIEEICFPETAIVSVVARGSDNRGIEAGLIGCEGMTGVAVVMGDDQSPNETYVQLAGTGAVIAADDLRGLILASSTLADHLLKYAHNLMVQTAQTALANGRATIEERLARWLLMAADRVGGSELALTHELLSLMLGVRRPGVTNALHKLEGGQLIRAKRASITIRDRPGLEAIANGFYGVAERDYDRLFGGKTMAANDVEPAINLAGAAS